MATLTEKAESLRINELVELTGSEKQVVWANSIREKLQSQWNLNVENALRRATDTDSRAGDPQDAIWLNVEAEIIKTWLLQFVFNQIEAKFWIDTRFENHLQKASLELRQTLREARAAVR